MWPQSLPHSTENAKIDSDINAAPLGIIDVGTSGNKFYSYLNKAAKNDHNAADIYKNGSWLLQCTQRFQNRLTFIIDLIIQHSYSSQITAIRLIINIYIYIFIGKLNWFIASQSVIKISMYFYQCFFFH